MLSGYSVREAASVLGIPERRVWELLARGVLDGTPEASGDMRVYLQGHQSGPSESPRKPAPPPGESPRGNGNGGAELSPFRELLTEFRNLTERYGQALLALGEARGEVASLRSRVDLLEARIDLRLAGPSATTTVEWQPPAEPAVEAEPMPEPEPMTEAESEAEAVAEAEPMFDVAAELPVAEEVAAEAMLEVPIVEPLLHEPSPRARGPRARRAGSPAPSPIAPPAPARRHTGRRGALESFAQALARAQDPTAAELPGGREAAEALAALQESAVAEAEPAMTAEPMTAPEPYAEAAPEIDEVAAIEAAAPEPMAAAPAELEPLPIEAAAPAEPEPEVVAEPEAEALAAEAASAETPEPISTLTPGYTTEVVEPDWFADGDFTWLEAAEAGAQATVIAEPETEPQPLEAASPPTAEAPSIEEPLAAEAISVEEPPAFEAAVVDVEGTVLEDAPAPVAEMAATEEAPVLEETAAEETAAIEEPPPVVAEAEPEPVAIAVEAVEVEAVPEPAVEEPPTTAVVKPPPVVAEAEPEPVAITVEAGEVEAVSPPAVEEPPITDALEEPPPAVAVAAPAPIPIAPPIELAATIAGAPAIEAAAPAPGIESIELDEPPLRRDPFVVSGPSPAVWPDVEGPAVSKRRRPRPALEPAQAAEEPIFWIGGEETTAAEETRGFGSSPQAIASWDSPAITVSDEELEQLAHDEGWDDAEIAAIRAFIGRGETEAAPATADLGVTPVSSSPQAYTADAYRPVTPFPSDATNPDWVRSRRGPAARVYRRLRRMILG